MTTKFIDGPAEGQILLLRRAPLLLRVVIDQQRTWDALDQLTDTAEPNEKVYVYQLVKDEGTMQLNMGRRGGGWYRVATYRLYGDQSDQETLHDNSKWQEWAQRESKLGRAWPSEK